MTVSGRVHLVGAGPGDPELLTIKALQLLQRADIVVYDRLVSDEIMDLVPTGTAQIFVGKMSGHHYMSQEQINELLVKLAKNGHEVVRLKGGDPLLFARGSEEASELAQHNIPFTIVPGITAATAIGASLGLPMTHRGLVSGVRFVTGHFSQDGKLDLNWKSLADTDTTLVIYMGLANIDEICKNLIMAGMPAKTSVCAISNGTLPDQRQCISKIGLLPEVMEQLNFTAPVLIIIGCVIEMIEELNWQNFRYEGKTSSDRGKHEPKNIRIANQQ